ncbi:MAG TPA: hypothetical protein IAD42_06375 [Candidatus Scatomorpha pullistercoris]|uniref:Extracellular solute-binding protein n=1 Tax=Candidatus Scatomorpha pullistercoris TaxID=2840929 RepID=A0A9D1G5F0_9FIRM|nr:hypothetical protein [Candidatus Scatomorpha pullistercoris]
MAAGGGGSLELGEGILDAFKELNPDVEIKIDLYDVQSMKSDESSFGVAITGRPLTNADLKTEAENGTSEYKVVMGIIQVDAKWWNDTDKVSEVWTPYFEEVGYTGDVVQYDFD